MAVVVALLLPFALRDELRSLLCESNASEVGEEKRRKNEAAVAVVVAVVERGLKAKRLSSPVIKPRALQSLPYVPTDLLVQVQFSSHLSLLAPLPLPSKGRFFATRSTQLNASN